MIYPAGTRDRKLWIEGLRGEKNLLSPWLPVHYLHEEEIGPNLAPVTVNTLFIANKECAFRCVMCDLWKDTLDSDTPLGAVPAQIDYALERLPPAHWIKLYNSGSFFDGHAIPVSDYAAIAEKVRGFERVIVECHPRLIGQRTLLFRDMLTAKLEVAMGLETADGATLEKLNKGFTLQQFEEKCKLLQSENIAIRVFLLVRPPFHNEIQGLEWAKRSLDFALQAGAEVCCLIPVRGGNGAMEALHACGQYAPPSLATLEKVQRHGLGGKHGRIFVDGWGLHQFADCECSAERIRRMMDMNQSQQMLPVLHCPQCWPKV